MQRLSGRVLFDRYKRIIGILEKIISIFPESVRHLMWEMSACFDGKLAIALRYVLLRLESQSCGSNVYVGKYVTVKNAATLSIGNNVSIHDGCYLDAVGGISIGNDVSIAHQTSLVSFDHCYSNEKLPIKYNSTTVAPVVIHNDVWIGCGVRILAGSRLNERSIVAAGAVVLGEVRESSIFAGVPAKLVKDLRVKSGQKER